MENNGRGIALISQDERAWEEMGKRLRSIMESLQDAVDSPKALLVLRNAVQTLLEAGEDFTYLKVRFLLSDADFRASIVSRLRESTPTLWSEGWNAAWHKDAEPLLSVAQEKMTRRNSLIVFWTTEWMNLPDDVRRHVLAIAGSLT